MPVGEGGKEGGIVKRWGGGKVVLKEGVPCGRCRKKSKKTCSDNAGGGGRETESAPQGDGATYRSSILPGKVAICQKNVGSRTKRCYSMWEVLKKVNKTCSENAGWGGREGGRKSEKK